MIFRRVQRGSPECVYLLVRNCSDIDLAVGMLAPAAAVVGNAAIASRLRPESRPLSIEQQSLERYRVAIESRRRLIGVVAGLGLGLLVGAALASGWESSPSRSRRASSPTRPEAWTPPGGSSACRSDSIRASTLRIRARSSAFLRTERSALRAAAQIPATAAITMDASTVERRTSMRVNAASRMPPAGLSFSGIMTRVCEAASHPCLQEGSEPRA